MGLGGCYSCMKYLFVFLNIIFLIVGVIGVIAATWMFIDPTFPLHFTQESNDSIISIVILLIAAIILVLVAVLGIYSAIKEIRWILVLCFSLLLIIIVAEVSAGVWGYLNRDILESQIRTSVKNTVQEDYHKDKSVKAIFDTIQERLECCGAEKATDWTRTSSINLAIMNAADKYNIPHSCCLNHISQLDCARETDQLKVGSEPNYSYIYRQGCYTLIVEKVRDSASIILGVGGAVLAVQLLGLILALVLAFTINRSMRYKA